MPKPNAKAGSEIAGAVRENGPRNHRDSLRRKPVSAGMDAALRRLIVTPNLARDALIDAFDGRASFAAITAWRFGWRGAPQWAVELIQSKIAAKVRADLAEANKLRPGAGMGWNKGAKTLAVWRERKARERDAKEKAAEIAALHRAPENET